MAFNTPTITHTRGRLVRHTYITAIATLNGTTAVVVDLDTGEMPLGVYAGTGFARSDGGTATDVTTIYVRNGTTSIGNGADGNVYQHALTLVTDPDYFKFASIFEQIDAPQNANFSGQFALPTNEWRLSAVSDNAAQTSETVTFHIALLSHVLEV